MSTADDQLPFGSRLGVFILAEISAISASSVVLLLGYIAYSTVTVRQGARRRWRLESPVHLFLLNQLVCDLIQSLGGLMNLKWVIDGNIHHGAFCTTQGLIKQLADVGTALSAGNVAIYTFSTLIFRLRLDTNISRAVLIVACIWFAIILNVAINIGINGASRFYGPTGPWCWITAEFSVQRTVADFMWMWISAFSSLLAYIALFLVLKGCIVVDGWRILWTYGQEHPVIPRSSILAYKMLAYPIIYIVTVIPLAAARYNDFAKGDTPFGVVVLADGFYLSSGFLNVLLYRYTRPYLLPRRTDSLNDQSIVLHQEMSSTFPTSIVFSNSHHISEEDSEGKSVDPARVHESPHVGYQRDGDHPTITFSDRDHQALGDKATGEGADNIYDDI